MASSGIHVAQTILVKDKKNSDTDSLQEDWADPDSIRQVLQDTPFEEGSLKLTISDELGRIQANSLVKFPEGHQFAEPQKGLWERFLWVLSSLNPSLENIESATIINSLKDWLDSGDDDAITGISGAESDYYQQLDSPYDCGNGPFTHISELALVKGIEPQLFQGTAEMPGISKYVTVHGITADKTNSFTYQGKININTAELPVLAALLPSGNEDLAEAIYDFRRETSDDNYIHDLSSPNWYKKVPGLGNIEIDSDLITTTSDVFRIEAVAELNAIKMTVTAVAKREKNTTTGKWGCRILHWQVE
jgi:general secretion pathway protein K